MLLERLMCQSVVLVHLEAHDVGLVGLPDAAAALLQRGHCKHAGAWLVLEQSLLDIWDSERAIWREDTCTTGAEDRWNQIWRESEGAFAPADSPTLDTLFLPGGSWNFALIKGTSTLTSWSNSSHSYSFAGFDCHFLFWARKCQVFLSVKIGDDEAEKVGIELFAKSYPKTAEFLGCNEWVA